MSAINSGSATFSSGEDGMNHNNNPIIKAFENWMSSHFPWLKRTSIHPMDIFLFAMTVVLGGQFLPPFEHGFLSIFLPSIFIGIGYVLLSFCLAEMTSTLPFSGGIYGFVRAFTLPIYGFYIACFEIILNITYIAIQIQFAVMIPKELGFLPSVFSSPEALMLTLSLLFYVSFLIINCLGGIIFWIWNTLLAIFCFSFLLIYIFGSIPTFSLSNLQSQRESSSFEFLNAFSNLSQANFLFVGIQFLSLTSKCAQNPRKDIPIVTCIAIIVIFITGIGITLTCLGNSPGIDIIDELDYPLNPGYSRIFQIKETSAHWITFPGLLATAFAFVFCTGRQAHMMTKSGLLPKILLKTLPFFETPYVALTIISILCFLLNIVLTYSEMKLMLIMIDICSLSSFIVFIGAFIAFLRFHLKYSSLSRYFKSPLGDKGAWIGLIIFILSFVGTVSSPKGGYISIVIIVGISVMIVLFFIFHVGKKHIFSEEEKEELFKAYLMNGKKN